MKVSRLTLLLVGAMFLSPLAAKAIGCAEITTGYVIGLAGEFWIIFPEILFFVVLVGLLFPPRIAGLVIPLAVLLSLPLLDLGAYLTRNYSSVIFFGGRSTFINGEALYGLIVWSLIFGLGAFFISLLKQWLRKKVAMQTGPASVKWLLAAAPFILYVLFLDGILVLYYTLRASDDMLTLGRVIGMLVISGIIFALVRKRFQAVSPDAGVHHRTRGVAIFLIVTLVVVLVIGRFIYTGQSVC